MADDLIPRGVRIAVRNAIGGWGPYSVSGIDDLFNSNGFVDRTPMADGYGGERRTRAEEYHARIDFTSREQTRRYLTLIEEVLEHWPEASADPNDPGQKLRRELRRAEIVRDPTGRLQLPGSEGDAEQKLDEATEGVWTPQRMRVFVSHTHAHRHVAAGLASTLDQFGFSCFVAHDDIEPSREWQDVIEAALSSCDLLIAFVTPEFSGSDWTDQEVGWALGRGVPVIPVRAGAIPYGFFGSYQAVPFRPESSYDSSMAVVKTIVTAIFNRQRPGATRLIERMTDLVVDAFCRSGSYDTVRRRFELLGLIPKQMWRPEHFERLEKAAEENNQITDGVILVPQAHPAPEAIAKLKASAGL